MKKKIILIGGAGFVGHALALSLVKKNYEVLIIDSLAVNNLLSLIDEQDSDKKLFSNILINRINLIQKSGVKLVVSDARDYHGLSRIIESFDPDVYVHLAGVSHANRSNKDPHSTFDHNLRTLENCLDNAKLKKKHFIFFSSSMVYGNFVNDPIKEDDPCKPIGIYGTLKYSGELIVKSYNQIFDLPYTIIRPSAVYGERGTGSRVAQVFIENAFKKMELKINGTGEEKLDFTYVDDLVEGTIQCIENKSAINETFNLTNGESRSMNDLISILEKEFPDLRKKYADKEKFMPKRGTLDISKAKEKLGYKPKNPIEIGYLKYIRWYKEFWNN